MNILFLITNRNNGPIDNISVGPFYFDLIIIII